MATKRHLDDDDADDGKGRPKSLVSKFLPSTFEMVEDEANHEYVGWNEDGTVLVIRKPHEFSEKILPKYFRHSNYSSFVRQLNMYGFTRAEHEDQAFKHPLFLRGKPQNLALMKRKTNVAKPKNTHAMVENQKKEIDKLMSEVKSLKQREQEFDEQLKDLRAENKHLDQENIQLWRAIEEAKKRQGAMGKKMKQMVQFMFYISQKGGKRIPGAAQALPKLLQAARDCGVDYDPTQDPSVGSFLGNSVPTNASNDLVRMDTIGSLGPLESFDASFFQPQPPMRQPDEIKEPLPPLGDANDNTLVPYQSADPLTRNTSIQSFMDAMEHSKDGASFGKYNSLARGLSKYINEQDDTLRRMESLSSTFSDPLGDISGTRIDEEDLANFDDHDVHKEPLEQPSEFQTENDFLDTDLPDVTLPVKTDDVPMSLIDEEDDDLFPTGKKQKLT